MTQIHGLDGLSDAELTDALPSGGRFVVYKYCMSFIVITLTQGSGIYFIRPGESAVLRGLPYTLLSLVLGWWGFPFGPIFTLVCFFTNFAGGSDVTNEVCGAMQAPRWGPPQKGPTQETGDRNDW